MASDGLTPFARWIARRGPFTRGMVYGFMLWGYAIEGAVRGAFAGIREGCDAWREDRALLEDVARTPPPNAAVKPPAGTGREP